MMAERDRQRNQHRLDAIDFASAAIEEAQYAVLDAQLARMTADSMAAAASA
jgi:hypothetical protein